MNKIIIKTAAGNIINQFTTVHDHIIVDLVPIEPDLSVEITSNNYAKYVTPRVQGNLANKAYYLERDFNWELKTDNNGALCLVPTKKK